MGEEVQMVAQMGSFLVDGIVVEDSHSVNCLYTADNEGQIQTLAGCNKGQRELEMVEQSWINEHINTKLNERMRYTCTYF